jgi:hypothetical protein
MHRYAIMLEGPAISIILDDKICKCGFFTTRWVKARNIQEAEDKAIWSVIKELRRYRDAGGDGSVKVFPEQMVVVEIEQLSIWQWFLSRRVNSGFSFFPPEEEPPESSSA